MSDAFKIAGKVVGKITGRNKNAQIGALLNQVPSNDLLNEIVFFLPLNEESGVVAADASAQGNDGEAFFAGILGNAGVIDTYAADFADPFRNVEIPNADSLLTSYNNITFNAWIKRTLDATTASMKRIFTIPRTVGGSTGLGFGWGIDHFLQVFTYDEGNYVLVKSAFEIPLNVPTMVTLVINDDTIKLFANGVLVKSGNAIITEELSAAPLILGNSTGGDLYHMEGNMNWASLNQIAWTDQQVLDVYNDGNGFFLSEWLLKPQTVLNSDTPLNSNTSL
ncbi:LamG-like jellyroll fold domain-containing protein [Sunxiuqinia indica]|uniref:LamG-like jellyroll fold domain-containing protein n=1 Tax=Sunxiuqinia indica TaxID=2692584 RepID=UPI001358F663|nr:LamG-like jellyroll fold domain-containing protein [Sunxiuqinia indica]